MNENNLFSSFMMLSEHLYDIFVQYIVSGRTRAPPETELVELLQTFQYGAKTDRRALQSKFKSWAKRMNFENGCLVLASSGKIIIPKEICDDLIIHLHAEEHTDIENIINKIRETYTWTRKNFGMDRDIVVESITRNCKKEECIKKMRLEMAKLGNSFCSGLPNIPVPGMIPEVTIGMTPPLPFFPPYHYPVPIPFPQVFSPNRFPFPIPFFGNLHGLESSNANEEKEFLLKSQQTLKAKFFPKMDSKVKERKLSTAQYSTNNLESACKATPGKFKKPKNLSEYKILMEAVHKNPKVFPKVLISKKNKFLSLLGLAPKSICSSRTLKRFRKELKHKQYMTRDCMIYRERKMLRDRNKLNKYSNEKKQHNYLGLITCPRKTILPIPFMKVFEGKQPQNLETANQTVDEKCNNASDINSVKVSDNEKKNSVEVITIDSSDEENFKKDYFLSIKEKVEEINSKQDEKNSSILKESSNQLLEQTSEQTCSIDTDLENASKNDIPSKQKVTTVKCSNNPDEGEENVEHKILGKNRGSETMQLKPIIPQRLHNTILKEKNRIILPKTDDIPASDKFPNISGNLLKEKYFAVPQFSVLDPTNSIALAPNRTRYPAAQLKSSPVESGRTPSSTSLSSTTSDALGKNNVARVVYPIKLTKVTPSNVLLLNKNQKGTYFVVPSYKRSILPMNDLRNQTQVKPKISTSAFPPRVRQLKPKPTSNEDIGKHRKLFAKSDSTKTDVNKEMARIAAWIYRMKSILNPCTLSNGSEKSVQKLVTQLDVGIYLVREAKKSLEEIEQIMDASEPSIEVVE